jgi:S1-C subfamily serine protease
MHSSLRPVPPLAGLAFAAALLLAFAACSTPETAPSVAPAAVNLAPPLPAMPSIAPVAPRGPIEDSVVKVVSTVRLPDPLRPWTKGPPTPYHGTGVVITGHRILTSLHGTEYGSDIRVQGRSGGDPVSATVEWLAPNVGLAILKLADDSFFATHPPLPLATRLPQVKDAMTVYGYPAASSTVSVTRTIVSGIDFVPYSYTVSGLMLQTAADVDIGQLGAPAVIDGAVAGLAVRRAPNGQPSAVGFIPAGEIALFLHDVADGHYDGKPGIFDVFQTLDNPALRAFLKVPASVTGLVVNTPYRDDADYPLKKWDVVARIGDTPIDDQGMVTVGGELHVRFNYLVQQLVHDGRVPLTIYRDGQPRTIELPVSPQRPLVEPFLEGAYPPYFIYGPIVFSVATQRYLITIRRSAMIVDLLSAVHSPLYTRQFSRPAFPGEQLVLISSPFFSDRLAVGYVNPVPGVVKTVNGIPIRNLDQLVQVLRDAQGDYVTIEFLARTGESLVFPRKEMAAATARILDANGIRDQGSPDAMAVWKGAPAP